MGRTGVTCVIMGYWTYTKVSIPHASWTVRQHTHPMSHGPYDRVPIPCTMERTLVQRWDRFLMHHGVYAYSAGIDFPCTMGRTLIQLEQISHAPWSVRWFSWNRFPMCHGAYAGSAGTGFPCAMERTLVQLEQISHAPWSVRQDMYPIPHGPYGSTYPPSEPALNQHQPPKPALNHPNISHNPQPNSTHTESDYKM